MSGQILVLSKVITSLVVDTYSGIHVANHTARMCVKTWGIQSACVEHVADTNLYQDHTGASLDKLTWWSYDNCAIHKSETEHTARCSSVLTCGCEKKMCRRWSDVEHKQEMVESAHCCTMNSNCIKRSIVVQCRQLRTETNFLLWFFLFLSTVVTSLFVSKKCFSWGIMFASFFVNLLDVRWKFNFFLAVLKVATLNTSFWFSL